MIKLTTPLTKEKLINLHAGDSVLLSGTIYTGRDAAHKRLVELIDSNNELPFDLNNSTIFYVGPAPTKPGEVIGALGPTTSYRMDDLTIPLLEKGLSGMIGKGNRNETVIQSIINYGAIYFTAIGGTATLLKSTVTKAEIIAFEDLGTEAIRKLEVKDFPVIVGIDSQGNSIFDEYKKYRSI